MPFKKYVEIEWEEIRLKPFKDWGKTQFYLNVATNHPTPYAPQGTEKLITQVDHKQTEDKTWIITPQNYPDRILFSGYVENLLQVAITVFESDKDSLSNFFSTGAEKLGQIGKIVDKIPGNLFPFLGISTLVFSGIAGLFKDMDDFLGIFVYQLRRDTLIPIGRPMKGEFQKGHEYTGEVDFGIYIKPEDAEYTVFYRDVEIFPFSSEEIAVYYSGDLSSSRQLYLIWTLDNWKSNPLVKMKKWGRYWMALLDIPKTMEVGSQLEIAFTDDEEHWDNKDGSNWTFQHFRWS